MARWRDEVQQNVYAVISEARITLDPRLLGKDVIVLPLKVADNFREAVHDKCVSMALAGRSRNIPGLVVNLITESGSVDDGKGNTGTVFIKL